jgi:hypothetical protein
LQAKEKPVQKLTEVKSPMFVHRRGLSSRSRVSMDIADRYQTHNDPSHEVAEGNAVIYG